MTSKLPLNLITAALLLASSSTMAQTFEEYQASINGQAEQNSQQPLNEFEQWQLQYLLEFETYRQAYLAEFDQYRSTLLGSWDDAAVSDNDSLVQYSNNNQLRTEVNYASNEVVISVVHDPEVTPDLTQIEAKLAQLSELTVATAAAQDPLLQDPSLATNTAPAVPQLQQVSEQQLGKMFSDAKVQSRERKYDKQAQIELEIERQVNANKRELERQAEQDEIDLKVVSLVQKELDDKAKQRRQRLANEYQKRAGDLTAKKITSYTIKLPSQQLSERAQPYLEFARQQSQQYQVELPLVLAIMRAESDFNPLARSHIPAFGLMQIVPSSAGVDVNQKRLKRNGAPSAQELFQAEFNITMGSAYLDILNRDYLKGISDSDSRLYCVIAAYNTGAGNVARAFNGGKNRRVRDAAKKINALSPEQVYDQLVVNLPYEETQNYLKKVTKYHQEFTTMSL